MENDAKEKANATEESLSIVPPNPRALKRRIGSNEGGWGAADPSVQGNKRLSHAGI